MDGFFLSFFWVRWPRAMLTKKRNVAGSYVRVFSFLRSSSLVLYSLLIYREYRKYIYIYACTLINRVFVQFRCCRSLVLVSSLLSPIPCPTFRRNEKTTPSLYPFRIRKKKKKRKSRTNRKGCGYFLVSCLYICLLAKIKDERKACVNACKTSKFSEYRTA